ncbi:MAG: Maf family protein [Myxococcales bacterium]|nr:Maf family protein [Myxococcales bacterium]
MSAAFVLASGSPRRRELLARVGLKPSHIRSPNIDESVHVGELPEVYAHRLAQEKAHVVRGLEPVLAADTVVALRGTSLGKPTDVEQASAMLRELSGQCHQVHTAVAVKLGKYTQVTVVTTDIRFRQLSEAEIMTYVDSGEPMDKAGAYGIQGAGGAFVANIQGSYTNVVGLPLEETLGLLWDVGVHP